jgi:predicted  nucleic acid-binding Zn-ribbon protein
MHPSVERLLAVQKHDREIRFLRDAMRLRPQELEDDRRKVASARELVRAADETIKRCRIEIDHGELEIRQCEAEIEKATVALNSAKTNQEYSIFKDQISRRGDARGAIEERVLEALTRLDQLNAERAQVLAHLEGQERAFARKEAEVGALVSSMSGQVEELLGKRAVAATGIDPDHLEMYDRILAHLQDLAIVQVRDDVCQGCHMSVTKQDRMTILIGESLVSCRSCGRLLFI